MYLPGISRLPLTALATSRITAERMFGLSSPHSFSDGEQSSVWPEYAQDSKKRGFCQLLLLKNVAIIIRYEETVYQISDIAWAGHFVGDFWALVLVLERPK